MAPVGYTSSKENSVYMATGRLRTRAKCKDSLDSTAARQNQGEVPTGLRMTRLLDKFEEEETVKIVLKPVPEECYDPPAPQEKEK